MQVSFENQSSQSVRLLLRGNTHILSSGQKKLLELDNQEPICALVDKYKPLRKSSSAYRLVVETEYHLDGLTDGCRIPLTREHIAIDVNMSYDRVFLHPCKGSIVQESYRVVNHPHANKRLQNDQRADAFLGPFWDMLYDFFLSLIFHPIRTLLGIAIAVGIGIHFGWYWMPIMLLGICLIAGLINMVINPLIEKFAAKITGVPTEEERLKTYCAQEGLSAFYGQPERTPFANKPIEY
ncbi:MAG: dicarboxylate/amino acid:cation symporter [Ruminococcaceae bacterium]|nr:dicarboxylate/amino acid:cation symporter [Oscillospiraceae bacterium]